MTSTDAIASGYRVSGISAAPFEPLFGLSDDALAAHHAKRYRVDAKPGYPDRVELRDAEIGESVLLVNFSHLPDAGPYRASHAIFVIEGAVKTFDAPGQVPELLRSRTLSLRAFDHDDLMVDADLVDGRDVETLMRGGERRGRSRPERGPASSAGPASSGRLRGRGAIPGRGRYRIATPRSAPMPFAIAPPAAVAPASTAPAASVARAELTRRGDDYVVARYYASCGSGPGARRTAAGDIGWVALTADLMERGKLGSACDGEALPMLLGEAMALRPRAVLPYVGRSAAFAPSRICLPPRIEPSQAQVRRDVARLHAALRPIRDPALAPAVRQCLDQAEAALRGPG